LTETWPWWTCGAVSCSECGLVDGCPHRGVWAVQCRSFVPTFIYMLKQTRAWTRGEVMRNAKA